MTGSGAWIWRSSGRARAKLAKYPAPATTPVKNESRGSNMNPETAAIRM